MAALIAATVLVSLSLSVAQSANAGAARLVPIAQWTTTTALPQPLGAWNAIVHNNAIYMIGGRNSADQPTKATYYANIQSTGELGAWVSMQPLPVALYLHSVSADESNVYVVGGWSGRNTESTVWRAPFNANGGLGAWTNVGAYPVNIDLHGSVIANGRLYVIGGWNGLQALNNVYYAETAAGGIGQWQAANPLPTPLYRLAVTVYNNVIYVSGGYDNNQTTRSSVYYARINADGSLSGWQATTPMPRPLYYHRLVVHDGQLVVLGGKDDTAEYSGVYAATINGDGTIGGWSTEPSLPQPLHRFGAVSARLHDSELIYVMGGVAGASVLSTVYHSAVPPAPTPTPTLPPVFLNVSLDNAPAHWVAPGEEIKYTIRYENNTNEGVSNVTLENGIPENTELVDNSLQPIGTVVAASGTSAVSWTLNNVGAGDSGQVSFTVRRLLPTPVSSVPSALSIALSGPTSVRDGETIRYRLTVTNEVPIELKNIVVTNELPYGADYVANSGGELVDGNIVQWTLSSMPADAPGPPRIPSTATFEYAVTAPHTLVNSHFRVVADPPSGSGPGPVGLGRNMLVTKVGNTDPEGPGDGIIIINEGATISWQYNDQVS
ncbi:MAG: hypothetical protein R2911_18435 [Caldilineaceae bacterium]